MTAKDQSRPTSKIIHGIISGLLIATLLLSVSRYIFEPKNRDRCQGMLNEGKWVSDEFKEWEPSGCMSIVYKTKEVGTCLTNQRVLYIGDSIMREQYFAMISLMGLHRPKKHAKHDDQHFFIKQRNVTLDLWWDPYINTSKTIDLFNGKIKGDKPTLLIVGSGPWYMKGLRDAYYSPWKEAIDRVFDGASNHPIADKVMVSPIEIVEEDKLTKLRKLTITHEKANIMNSYLRERESLLSNPAAPLVIPFAWNEIVTTSVNQTDDGLHFKLPVTVQQAQLALNYRCNNDPSIKTVVYPYDTTCCYTYPQPAWYQTSILMYILLLVPLGVIVYYLPSNRIIDFIRPLFPSTLETSTALFIFGLGLIYMFIGDRSQLFGKMAKHFDPFTFTILNLFVLFLGIITIKSSDSKIAGFLNRDQTDEWKGWMQLAILVYHFVGASRTAGIYNPMRVLVAAYLFQTGYGHFFFFYKKGDFGAARFLNVMVRMNLLTCVLCYLMKTDYLFYYFSPLVTFWFCVIWVTMRILPSYNKKSWFILAKISIMSVMTSVIIHYKGVLEGSFSVLAYLFKIQWNVTDWRFRLALDAWIVYIGMVCALVTIKCGEYKVSANYARMWISCKWVACILSILGLVGYFMFELQYTKASYTKYHPYISWIPILSFVVLRNATQLGRSTYSRFFAFVGKFSLETYIGQFHMWLAADTRGLLVVLPNTTWVLQSTVGWYFNLAISTVLFFFVCYYLSQTTGTLTKWLCSGAQAAAVTTTTTTARTDDAVPLLPTKQEENVASPAQLLVGRASEESAIDLDDAWGESMMKSKPTLYQRLKESIVDNYWIRAFVCLILLGIMNRFCSYTP